MHSLTSNERYLKNLLDSAGSSELLGFFLVLKILPYSAASRFLASQNIHQGLITFLDFPSVSKLPSNANGRSTNR
jgi:hypothetical protein